MSAPPNNENIKFPPVEEQLAYLKKGAAEVIPDADLKAKLENSFKTGTPLRAYLGVDPTAPDIHLGHTVVLRKLKHFQDLGHTAIFLIGDFSAMIGDPTGQSETRPPLTREQVTANANTYLAQVFKLLDPKKTEVRYNSEWLDKLSSYDVVRLCGHYRLARMLEREDFRSRLANSQPISVHELLYPLLTAYDAVALKSDVEIGATEQKFNLLVHRDIQREYGLSSEVALTMPILVGLDGERKMSKSLGNYVGITETPREMFGKLMSISDDQMWLYMELLTDRPPAEITRLRRHVAEGHAHPMEVKIALAQEIIAGFHGQAAATHAADEFRQVFQKRGAPSDVETHKLPVGDYTILKLLTEQRLATSRSDAERLIKQGAVELNRNIIRNMGVVVQIRHLTPPGEWLLRVGKKKFLRIIPGLSEAPQRLVDESSTVLQQSVPSIEMKTCTLPAGSHSVLKILIDQKLAPSRSDAEKLIRQGYVKWNGQVISTASYKIQIGPQMRPGSSILQVGASVSLRIIAGPRGTPLPQPNTVKDVN